MGKAKGRAQIEKGVVDKAEPAPAEPPWRPAPSECETDPQNIPVGDLDRIVTRLTYHQERLVGFALIHQTRRRISDAWCDVVRADDKHDEVHYHRFDQSGREFSREVLLPIKSQKDIEIGYDIAWAFVEGKMEENLRRWWHGS